MSVDANSKSKSQHVPDEQVAATQDLMLDANEALKDHDLQRAFHKLDQAKRQTSVAMQEAYDVHE